MIRVRDLMMCPKIPIRNPSAVAIANTPRCDERTAVDEEEHWGTLYLGIDGRPHHPAQHRRRPRQRASGTPATCRANRPPWSRSWPPSSASRSSSRARRASARPSSPRRCARYLETDPGPAAVLRGPRRGQGAVRVELPQAAAAHPDRDRRRQLARRAGRHLRRGVPAPPPADDRDRLDRAGRPADRRDRQDRPGVRGDAARAAVRLPDLDPRARPDRGDHPARWCCSPPTTRAS